MKKVLMAAMCAAILAGAGTAQAITVVNGSFETGDFTGWYPSGTKAQVVTSSLAYDGTVYNPIDGNYMAEITATAYILEGQSWNAGEEFGFNWAFLGYDYLPFNDSATFKVVGFDDTVIFSATLSSISAIGNYNDTGWQTFSYTFATAGTGKFVFDSVNALDSALSSKLLIDAVGNPVPEPTTMLLFGAGLAGLAAVGRRRKN